MDHHDHLDEEERLNAQADYDENDEAVEQMVDEGELRGSVLRRFPFTSRRLTSCCLRSVQIFTTRTSRPMTTTILRPRSLWILLVSLPSRLVFCLLPADAAASASLLQTFPAHWRLRKKLYFMLSRNRPNWKVKSRSALLCSFRMASLTFAAVLPSL